ncbi:MAG: UDP-3-O-acylglucosamine N-acyltransferase [Verrucomicrobiota bacterium]|jgi:UDP-3-O-[3-hydroxymyristoyl] glucosamine N-acyltransferase
MPLSFTIAELAALTGVRSVEGERSAPITGISGLAEATSAELSFLGNNKYASQVAASKAGAILVPLDFEGRPASGQVFLRVEHPSYALALLCSVLEARLWPRPAAGVHASAVVAASAQVDPSAHIGPLCVVGEGARVGSGAVLEARCFVGAHASVGQDCWLKPGVVVGDYCILGARCRLQSGAVIGSDGFGYEPVKGSIQRIPQIGNVVLEDDVEVGANSTLDRARFSQTVVGRGTKIDNLVQIAHNVRIGRQCLITAQVGIAGSTTLGDHCVLGGQAGVAGHLTLGDRVKLGAQAGLFTDVPADGFMNGTPATDFGLERRLVVLSRRLPELFKKVDSLAASSDSAGR